MNPIKIGNQRELFWDEYLINTSLTGAYLKQHQPRLGDIAMVLDKPWEGDGSDYFSIVRDGDIYRMYFVANWTASPDGSEHAQYKTIKICCIESDDGGITWYRPELDIHPYGDCEKTNILIDLTDVPGMDNFHCFIDENPNCLPEEKFKATFCCGDKEGYIWCWTSADGYHFKPGWRMTNRGMFDTQNVAFWSPEHGKYFCFIRGFHNIPGDNDLNAGIRDIRVIVSDDFKNWSDPVYLDYCGADDIPLYTNAIFRYPRAPQMMIGMPSRYVERHEWNDNFAQMPDPDRRQSRMKLHPRYGLTTTDCVLMTSRDGYRWNRQDEAWLTPGIERPITWVYGDCYPAVGVFQTPSALPGAPDELSVYSYDGHWCGTAAYLRRNTIRMDGFFSYRADYAPQQLVTKPLLYEGGKLSLNFSTSARGYIYVTVKCGKEAVHSCELFGDTLDRTVPFDGELEAFAGKEITLEFTMSDADLYSMQFVK